jgi:hypothetical protein
MTPHRYDEAMFFSQLEFLKLDLNQITNNSSADIAILLLLLSLE